jgi:hypothetical protein
LHSDNDTGSEQAEEENPLSVPQNQRAQKVYIIMYVFNMPIKVYQNCALDD